MATITRRHGRHYLERQPLYCGAHLEELGPDGRWREVRYEQHDEVPKLYEGVLNEEGWELWHHVPKGAQLRWRKGPVPVRYPPPPGR